LPFFVSPCPTSYSTTQQQKIIQKTIPFSSTYSPYTDYRCSIAERIEVNPEYPGQEEKKSPCRRRRKILHQKEQKSNHTL